MDHNNVTGCKLITIPSQEIKLLADLAHEYDMYLHVDGAHIANAKKQITSRQ
jgi:threonine aldolase